MWFGWGGVLGVFDRRANIYDPFGIGCGSGGVVFSGSATAGLSSVIPLGSDVVRVGWCSRGLRPPG
jgi:hypothetical protein